NNDIDGAGSSNGYDYLYGRLGNDTIWTDTAGLGWYGIYAYGEGGNDLLLGNLGIDYLSGGSENDTIYGNASNDTLNGGSGTDVGYGGDGSGDVQEDIFETWFQDGPNYP